ncbi:MAG TPA: glutathione S-transferase N-terminal domain-containing protein [Polyangiaceae bacterium]
MTELYLLGRSSSHFTRIAKIFAHELGVRYDFRVVHEIGSTRVRDFGDNPALRVPSLRSGGDIWFGSLNICRELARRATVPHTILWPEDVREPIAANAQELVLETMASEVTVVMARMSGIANDHPFMNKPYARIRASVEWLDAELPGVFSRLPPHSLGFLEVSALCLFKHLGFREILSIDDRPSLVAFCKEFERRPSAAHTEFHFDPEPAATDSQRP